MEFSFYNTTHADKVKGYEEPQIDAHTIAPTRSLTQVSSDTKSSMNSEQFDTLDSSVVQYDPILMLSLNFDLPLPPIDN